MKKNKKTSIGFLTKTKAFFKRPLTQSCIDFIFLRGQVYDIDQTLTAKERKQHFTIKDNAFNERAKNFGAELFKMTYSFIKVIALTTATIILFRLFSKIYLHGEQLDYTIILHLLLWLISFISYIRCSNVWNNLHNHNTT